MKRAARQLTGAKCTVTFRNPQKDKLEFKEPAMKIASIFSLSILFLTINGFSAQNAHAQDTVQPAKIILLSDKNSSEPKVIAMATWADGDSRRVAFYTCLGENILQNAQNMEAALSTCKHEFTLTSGSDVEAFVTMVTDYAKDHQYSSVAGWSVAVPVITAGLIDIFREVSWSPKPGIISAWNKYAFNVFHNKSQKYLKSGEGAFYTKQFDNFKRLLNAGGAPGGNYRYTGFVDEAAAVKYGRLEKQFLRIKGWGAATIALVGVGTMIYVAIRAGDMTASQNIIPSVTTIATTTQQMFQGKDGAAQEVSVHALIAAFRDMGYTDFGKFGVNRDAQKPANGTDSTRRP